MLVASLVALVAAAAYGGADFLGGLASRRGGVLASLLVVQAGGFAVVLPALTLLQPAGVPDRVSVAWSVAGGAAGAVGLIVFFRVLVDGLMSLGAPLTAVAAAGLPVLAGVALGERPEARAWLGIGAGLLAVGLISGVGGTGRAGARPRTIGLALAAGAAFGLFFVCLSRTSTAAGLWPLAVARMTSLAVIAAAALVGRARIQIEPGPLRLAFASGVADMLANGLFLVAERRGGLALVAVLVSLYPAATILLSLALLRERLRPVQASGVGLALVAVALIAGS
ncbi:MAG TPA: EamA family transporter [Candidatus Dormibacteraeota bacterium]|nr:EamA family transporter [Candidatus Dormibacteraeota bacterium]